MEPSDKMVLYFRTGNLYFPIQEKWIKTAWAQFSYNKWTNQDVLHTGNAGCFPFVINLNNVGTVRKYATVCGRLRTFSKRPHSSTTTESAYWRLLCPLWKPSGWEQPDDVLAHGLQFGFLSFTNFPNWGLASRWKTRDTGGKVEVHKTCWLVFKIYLLM